jgi:hypothetical protein
LRKWVQRSRWPAWFLVHKSEYPMKSSVFWGITSYRPMKVNWRFGGTYRLHFQGRRWGDMFFRNVGWRRYIAEDRTLHKHRCENHKSYVVNIRYLHKANTKVIKW